MKWKIKQIIFIAFFSILRLSSDIDIQGPKSQDQFSKARVFLRCYIKMLSSCGSKHKNYIANHENALEKTVQGLVDDVGDIIIQCKVSLLDMP